MSIETFVVLDTTSCGVCGVKFAMPSTLLARRRDQGGDFWCPNGHCLEFRTTEADRLRKELEQTKRLAESLDRSVANLNEYATKQEIRAESAKRAAKRANQKLKELAARPSEKGGANRG